MQRPEAQPIGVYSVGGMQRWWLMVVLVGGGVGGQQQAMILAETGKGACWREHILRSSSIFKLVFLFESVFIFRLSSFLR